MNRMTTNPLTMAPTTAFSSKRSDECPTRMHMNDQYEYGGGDHALTFDETTINQSKDLVHAQVGHARTGL